MKISKAKPLALTIFEGSELTDDVLREHWSLRLEFLTLNKTLEDDWSTFCSFVRGEGEETANRCLFSFADPSGHVQGFFTIAFLPVDVGRRRMLLLFSKYFYFRRAYRGHPSSIMAPWRLLPMSLQRFGMRSIHFVTTAFPQSYVSLYRSSGRAYSLRESETPPWKRKALETFAKAFCGENFDVSTGLVSSATVADSDTLPRSQQARKLHQQYLRLNPDWQQGYSLPILFSLDARLVYHNLRRMARRIVRSVRPEAQ